MYLVAACIDTSTPCSNDLKKYGVPHVVSASTGMPRFCASVCCCNRPASAPSPCCAMRRSSSSPGFRRASGFDQEVSRFDEGLESEQPQTRELHASPVPMGAREGRFPCIPGPSGRGEEGLSITPDNEISTRPRQRKAWAYPGFRRCHLGFRPLLQCASTSLRSPAGCWKRYSPGPVEPKCRCSLPQPRVN